MSKVTWMMMMKMKTILMTRSPWYLVRFLLRHASYMHASKSPHVHTCIHKCRCEFWVLAAPPPPVCQ